jgi:hypothetical protein
MPIDCIIAYIVVGPTNENPRLRSVLLSAMDSGVVALNSKLAEGIIARLGAWDQINEVSG